MLVSTLKKNKKKKRAKYVQFDTTPNVGVLTDEKFLSWSIHTEIQKK